MTKKKYAIYPLSADPIHNGHIHTLRYTVDSGFFDKIYFAIGVNGTKGKSLFDMEEREKLSEIILSAENLSDRVEVVSFSGLMRNYAKLNGIDFVIRGYRNGADAEYEFKLAEFNAEYALKTWVVPSSPKLKEVSSGLVKVIASEFGLVNEIVHSSVKQALEERLRGVSLIGVTGVMGAGKSTFCEELVKYAKENGKTEVSHLDFDKLVHSLYTGNSALSESVKEDLRKSFGEGVFEGESLNRRKLSEIVFGSIEKRMQLTRILEKPSKVIFEEELRQRKGIVLVDAAYFTEYNMLPLVNYNTILVTCNEDERMGRIFKRDGMNREEAESRTRAQHGQDDKRKRIKEEQEKVKYGFFYEVDSSKTNNFSDVMKKIESNFPLFKQESK